MKRSLIATFIIAALAMAGSAFGYQDTFDLESCHLRARGASEFYIPLIPGYTLVYEGEEDGETVTLVIEVLRRVKMVEGVRCAIVREMEWKDDELYEISWNYYSICRKTRSVYYFGEDVNFYENGEVIGHDGAWLAGVDGAKAGLIMPGDPILGARYYQEIAPGVALDRAEHISVTAEVEVEAGEFEACLAVAETNGEEPGDVAIKYYARGVGMVKDGPIELIEYGFGILDE